jgi:hypothetical protein
MRLSSPCSLLTISALEASILAFSTSYLEVLRSRWSCSAVMRASAVAWSRRGLRLFQRGFLFLQLLLGAAGIEADHRVAFLHRAAGRRLPHDAQRGNVDRRGDLHRAAGLELTAAAHDDGEIALARGRRRQGSGGLHLAQPVDAGGGCGKPAPRRWSDSRMPSSPVAHALLRAAPALQASASAEVIAAFMAPAPPPRKDPATGADRSCPAGSAPKRS